MAKTKIEWNFKRHLDAPLRWRKAKEWPEGDWPREYPEARAS